MALTGSGDEVRRLFECLVEELAGRAPHLLDTAFPVSDLYERIVPYRTHRTSLGFDTHQDYEMALLRLVSGEEGLVDLEPGDARTTLAREAKSVNPNTGAFRAYPSAPLRLNPQATYEVLERRRASGPVTAPRSPLPAPVVQPVTSATPDGCPHCEEHLPTGRRVVFCPFCGGDVAARPCPACGTALEAEWRHCITCGYKVGGSADRRIGGP